MHHLEICILPYILDLASVFLGQLGFCKSGIEWYISQTYGCRSLLLLTLGI
jgi:hypothetical protein